MQIFIAIEQMFTVVNGQILITIFGPYGHTVLYPMIAVSRASKEPQNREVKSLNPRATNQIHGFTCICFKHCMQKDTNIPIFEKINLRGPHCPVDSLTLNIRRPRSESYAYKNYATYDYLLIVNRT